jgi:Arc/MetJ-type ribon-helix-helix transcriptional regulator
MSKAKIVITLDDQAAAEIDRLVDEGMFPNRSQAIEEFVRERMSHIGRSRLVRECAKLDRVDEQALADECYASESESPAY